MSDRVQLRRVALGEAPADLLVTGGTVLNVYTFQAIPQAIPALRLTTRGLLDVKTQQRLPVLL